MSQWHVEQMQSSTGWTAGRSSMDRAARLNHPSLPHGPQAAEARVAWQSWPVRLAASPLLVALALFQAYVVLLVGSSLGRAITGLLGQ